MGQIVWTKWYGPYRMDIAVTKVLEIFFATLMPQSPRLRLEKNGKFQQRKWANRSYSNDHQHFVTNICHQHRCCETIESNQSIIQIPYHSRRNKCGKL